MVMKAPTTDHVITIKVKTDLPITRTAARGWVRERLKVKVQRGRALIGNAIVRSTTVQRDSHSD